MVSQDQRLMTSPLDRTLDRPLTDLVPSKPYAAAGGQPTNIRDYLFVILKRKWLILSLVVVVTSLVTIQMFRTPSVYEGITTIRIEPKRNSILQTKDIVINSSQVDPNFIGTQLKLLQNPMLARQVVLTLDLQNNTSFLGGQSQRGFFSSLRNIFNRENKPKVASPAVATGVTPISESALNEQALSPEELSRLEPYEDAITGNELVEPIEKTSLVQVKFQHTDPVLAQKVPNTIAEVFISNNLDRATTGSKKAEEVLAREIAKTQLQVQQAQEKQFNYAKLKNLPITTDPVTNVENIRLKEISSQLLDAAQLRMKYEAEWNKANSSDPFAVEDVQKSEYISKLRETVSALKEKKNALLIHYTEEWPEVQQINAQLKPREQELSRAVTETINAVKSRYETARDTEQKINRSYMAQRGTTTQQTHDQIEMLSITQGLDTNKQYLNTLMQRKRELEATQGSTEKVSDISVATFSRLPKQPIGPPRLRNIMIALMLSLVAGIGLAFLLDFLDDTVNSMEDVDRYIHLPALALIPASKGDKARLLAPTGNAPAGASNALALVDDARSPVAEAYRHLRTSLLLSSAGQPPKTILVTSSQPSEGKTTTAINTAVMLAQTGAEVLIIDCDLRRPRLHAHFEVSNSVGLTNWLSGEKNVDALIQSYEKRPNLKLLTSGPVPPNPAELLGSDEMRKLLALLSERFAHIIIDSPPAISFTDASILSTMVDGVVLIVHGGKSSRAVVRRARQQLLDVGANIFGVVLNNVKLESQQDYYYAGYYGYYSSYYYSGDGDEKTEGGATAPR